MSESFDAPNPGFSGGVIFGQPTVEPATMPGSRLLDVPGVEGHGLTQAADGNDAIIVFVRDATVAEQIPPAVDGLPTVVSVTGPIEARRLLDDHR